MSSIAVAARVKWYPGTFCGRIEAALQNVLRQGVRPRCPPKLAAALDYAVFPGGSRLRPSLCLAVASALGDCCPDLTDASAVALELLHCASLVHDDLACFDDAETRRGKPALHRQFGEPLALLVGDGLIVLAFKALAAAAPAYPARIGPVFETILRAIDTENGIVSGQAWELEESVDVTQYHRAKTGALFEAATACGALSAGCDPAPWRTLGGLLGQAYQAADDIADLTASSADMGKPARRDVALGRPSLAVELGVEECLAHVTGLLQTALSSVPPCGGRSALLPWLEATAKQIMAHRLGLRYLMYLHFGKWLQSYDLG